MHNLYLPYIILSALFIALVILCQDNLKLETIKNVIINDATQSFILAGVIVYLHKFQSMLRGYTQAESRKISELGKNVLVLSDIVNTMREMSQVNSKKNPDAKVSLLRETESLINTRQNTEYSDDVETLWVNYKILINQKVKKENRSLTQTFKVLGKKIKLSSATLAGFYRHQTNPQRSTLDKIKKWVDEEGENSNLRKQE